MPAVLDILKLRVKETPHPTLCQTLARNDCLRAQDEGTCPDNCHRCEYYLGFIHDEANYLTLREKLGLEEDNIKMHTVMEVK